MRAAGGTANSSPTPGGAPLVVGELRSAREDAPTVMIYGHYDVQDPGDLETGRHRRSSPRSRRPHLRPRRDRRQGQLPPAAARRVRDRGAGELPVHIRVLIEGAEESGSDDVGEWVRADARGADA